MPLHPRLTGRGLALVQRFEGYRARAARLPGGGWVVGHGHTLSTREGAHVTPAEAEALLLYDLSQVAGRVETVLMAPVTPHQFEALTAFAFHIGPDAFDDSDVLRRLNEGAYLQAAAAMELWRRAEVGGQAVVVDAFVRRRAAEKAHFLTRPAEAAGVPGAVARPLLDRDVLAIADRWPSPNTAVVAADEAHGVLRPVLVDPPGLLGEPAPSAVIAAADSVAARLSRILAETAPPPQHPPAMDVEGAASAPPEPAPFPALLPALAPEASRPAPGPRGFTPTVAAPRRARWRSVLEDWRLLAALAVIGLGLLAFAVLSLATGRPSLGPLLLGLLGVAALMPALGARLAR